MSLCHCLGRTKGSVQARGTCICFVSSPVFRLWVLSTSSNPQAGGQPLFGCPRLLFQYIPSYCPYWRPFLRPQPEDAPCLCDRYPLMMDNCFNGTIKNHFRSVCFVLRKAGKRGLYCTVFGHKIWRDESTQGTFSCTREWDWNSSVSLVIVNSAKIILG